MILFQFTSCPVSKRDQTLRTGFVNAARHLVLAMPVQVRGVKQLLTNSPSSCRRMRFQDFSLWNGETAVHGADGLELKQDPLIGVPSNTLWQFRIDNFPDVHATAESWAAQHPARSSVFPKIG